MKMYQLPRIFIRDTKIITFFLKKIIKKLSHFAGLPD